VNKLFLSIATASMLLAGVGVAAAQSEGPSAPPSWQQSQGVMMTQYSTTNHYTSFTDPNMQPTVGMVLPESVTVYELPNTMSGPAYTNYRYGMINNQPVVVESTTRKVVHTWN
jgi:hypothetical protein